MTCSFEPTGRVIVLGAGASRFAGYPLAQGLWPFVLENAVGDQDSGQISAALQQLFGPLIKLMFTDLESALTNLDMGSFGSGPFAQHAARWRELRPRVVGLITDAFGWYEHCVQRSVLDRERVGNYAEDRHERADSIRATLDNWMKFIRPGDVVLTLNWDALHDAALFRAGLWHYRDGYGFQAPQASVGPPSAVRLLKLHGSITWMQRDQLDPTPAVDNRLLRAYGEPRPDWTRGAGRRDAGRDLIIPTYVKDPSSNRALLDVWAQAAEALKSATELLVIGYSLPPADVAARQLLGLALTRGGAREITIVAGPDADLHSWQEFSDVTQLRMRPVRKRFEDWIMRVQP